MKKKVLKLFMLHYGRRQLIPRATTGGSSSLRRRPGPRGRDPATAADFRDNSGPSPGTGPPVGPTPTATAALLSEVLGQALQPGGGDGASTWPWLLLAGGLVFVGGTGAGVAGVGFLFGLARGVGVPTPALISRRGVL